ncbi:dephospho-CoA kinase [Xylocopilactobacillus apis]|uniref:Dephospho-CoA kinase n=1 Tax=Xylocopilactobacillus apis TaxID=2932183 RepID=A0AAU9DN97_9LACO|nr:dephospho-CoA kinase [Xylocopilactobacillus apis]BDR56393.1 dephospho-CoA kinase [Xylocopilactobacillus apis]
MSNSQIIGITGGIGTGKSYVGNIIRSLGFLVLDSDKIAHDVLNENKVIEIIENNFGAEVLTENGLINRKALGNIVFKNSLKLSLLNHLLDPYLRSAIINQLKVASKPVFIEIQLLYEQHYEEYLDQVIVIYADNQTAANRIQERDHVNLDFAKKKISSQMPISEKIKKADYVIDTTKNNVKEQVIDFLNKIDLLKVNKE